MKLDLIKNALLLTLGLSFTACEQSDNFLGKEGIKCDAKKIISLTEQILNTWIHITKE